jgi:hypothetical protein
MIGAAKSDALWEIADESDAMTDGGGLRIWRRPGLAASIPIVLIWPGCVCGGGSSRVLYSFHW